MDISIISYILRAKNRRKVLLILSKEKLTPAQIMKRTGMYESHVSRTLKELKDKKLIKCENPKERRFKFYSITNEGKKVSEKANKIIKEIKE